MVPRSYICNERLLAQMQAGRLAAGEQDGSPGSQLVSTNKESSVKGKLPSATIWREVKSLMWL